ncbi:helix-turn-helix domain-containing protein [Rhizobium sp. BK251]|uniref:helix-turn-helix domain-containing protein n=1 Tax=Rhizobium sp. BK251 TaxID=2512125 RepID=UPI00104B2F0F|nr:helix-turn-helix domain-containing protein [Rhizobium sp. BK251]TCL70501.1 AraC family transcriptional regulator [Rhizobium sp. BK251]
MPDDISSNVVFDFEAWRVLLRDVCGRYSPEQAQPTGFIGRVRANSLCGCDTVEIGCNARRVERTGRDCRLDSMDHYYAVFQLDGRSTVMQNDHVATLEVGDVALVDSTRPVTYHADDGPGRWLSLHLPRQSLLSHLGLELEGGVHGRGNTAAGRLLYRLVSEAAWAPEPGQVDPYLHLAVYDLLGALFGASEIPAVNPHSDRLFVRVCDIIKSHYTDPDIGPCEVAAEAGISLRYLQKLFTQRGSTCCSFIQRLRLEHAARLIRRRGAMKTGQPLSLIAYDSGFRDYTHFARAFRGRFGSAPGATAGEPNSRISTLGD